MMNVHLKKLILNRQYLLTQSMTLVLLYLEFRVFFFWPFILKRVVLGFFSHIYTFQVGIVLAAFGTLTALSIQLRTCWSLHLQVFFFVSMRFVFRSFSSIFHSNPTPDKKLLITANSGKQKFSFHFHVVCFP